MIDLYAAKTGNCRKISIYLEEAGVDYNVKWIDLNKDEQFNSNFKKVNPNSKVPAIVDLENKITVFESGAILIYLAEKYGKLYSKELQQKATINAWLFFQVSGVGPTFGQYSHFMGQDPVKNEYALKRFDKEYIRLLNVIENQLQHTEYITGDYSIADIALFPWINMVASKGGLEKFPKLLNWNTKIFKRPTVQKGYKFGDK